MSVLMDSSEVVALGWTLLHFCWQSTIIALVYVLVDRCLFHTSTAMRYGVAMTMLALMPLVAIATFVEQERLVVHPGQSEQTLVASHVGSFHTVVVTEAPFAAPAIAGAEVWIAGHADRLMPWMDGVWLAGVCLLALRAAGGWWRLRSLRSRAQLAVPAPVQQSFAKVAGQLRLVQPVVLRLSREVISPMAMGIWWTTVMLPLSIATSLPAAQLEAVLAHELAHIRRWDYVCNLLQTAIECLFFFHPAVWWMSRRARELREVCCDEVAARTTGPGIYAEALLQMEEHRAKHLQLAVALHGKGGTLLNRIRRVMGERTMEYKAMSVVRVAAAGLVVAGLGLAPHLEKRSVAESAESHAAPGTLMATASRGSVVLTATAIANKSVAVEVNQVAQAPTPAAAGEPAPAPMLDPPSRDDEMQDAENAGGRDYLDKMRDAGFPLDLDQDLDTIISLRSMGVTPEYAKAMAATGIGTPTTQDLVSMKSRGITPEYVAHMKAAGFAPDDLQELISLKSLGVTPEYAKAMRATGTGTPTTRDLVSMKALGITPEYVAHMKAAGLAPGNLNELMSLRALGVTPEYAKSLADAGFPGISTHGIVSLKARGVTPESVRWIKSAFPNADIQDVCKAAVFHIDEEFLNKARAHGFHSTDLDKLVKLKISDLLD